MATELERLEVVLGANTKGLQKEFKKVEGAAKKSTSNIQKQTKKLDSTFKTLGGTIQKAFVAFAAISAVIGTIKAITGAWEKQEKAITSLNAALAATGKFSSQASRDIQAEASRLQGLTTAGDEAIIQGISAITQLTDLDPGGLVDIQSALVGISDTFFKGDINSAALIIGKSIGSTTNALSRYGIQIDATASQQEKLAQILAQSDKFFEVSQANADTLGGRFAQLSNATGDLAETLGRLLVEGTDAKGVFEGLTKTITGLNKVITETAEKTTIAKQQFDVFGQALKTTFQQALEGNTESLKLFGSFLVASYLEFIQLTENVGRKIGEAFQKAWQQATIAFAKFNKVIVKGFNITAKLIGQEGISTEGFDKSIQDAERRLGAIKPVSLKVDTSASEKAFSDFLTSTGLKEEFEKASRIQVKPPPGTPPPGLDDPGSLGEKGKKVKDRTAEIAEQTQLLQLSAQQLVAEKQLADLRTQAAQLDFGTEQAQNQNELAKIALDQERANLELKKARGQISEQEFQAQQALLNQKQVELNTNFQLANAERERQQIGLEIKQNEVERQAELTGTLGKLQQQLAALQQISAPQQEILNKQKEIEIEAGLIEQKYKEQNLALQLQLEALGLTEEQIKNVGVALGEVKATQDETNVSTSQMKDAASEVEGAFKQIGDALANSIGEAIKTGEFDLKSFASSILDTFLGLAQSLTTAFAGGLFGGGGGGLGGLLGGGGGGLPGFAAGGSIPGGTPAIVGERGPELFMSKSPGRIVSNADIKRGGIGGGSSQPIVINNNISAMDSQDVLRALSKPGVQKFQEAQAIGAIQRQSNKTLQRSTME